MTLSLHGSPCQLQHSGLQKGKGENRCTDQLNYRNTPLSSKANSSTRRFPVPFPAMTQRRLLFLTSGLGGRLERAGERTERKRRIAHAENIFMLT